MTEQLLLHSITARQLKGLQDSLPHAILISGADGVGKDIIARQFVLQIFGAKTGTNNAGLLHISPENNGVGIEEVRKIRDFLNRKTSGTATIRRVVLITCADTMTSEAQNALLKTLEEPPLDTIVILTANDPTALKQTIRSRSQQLCVMPVNQFDAETYFGKSGYAKSPVQKAYYMSEGRVGLLKAILEGAKDHPLVGAIAKAKEVLNMSQYDRLLIVDELAKDKERLALLLLGLERVIASGLHQAADKNNAVTAKKFYHISKQVQEAKTSISKNGNTKLVLTDLFLNL